MTVSPSERIKQQEQQLLLELARASIESGLSFGRALKVDPACYPEPLREPEASFVTLRLGERLRGCIGSLQSARPLVADVAQNAFSAAFSDHRFDVLTWSEYERLTLEVSVLTAAQPIVCGSRKELLGVLRPGVDGVILKEKESQATLLPQFWEKVSGAAHFLECLLTKAGLPKDYWSESIVFHRYQVQAFLQRP